MSWSIATQWGHFALRRTVTCSAHSSPHGSLIYVDRSHFLCGAEARINMAGDRVVVVVGEFQRCLCLPNAD